MQEGWHLNLKMDEELTFEAKKCLEQVFRDGKARVLPQE